MTRILFPCCIALLAAGPTWAEDLIGAGSVTAFDYKKTPQGVLQATVHLPKDWKPNDQRPAIVFFFGGGWNSGNIRQFEPQAEYFASRGLVTVRADYRVKSRQETTPKEAVEDAKSAVRWLRQSAKLFGVDPERIVASGGSAGGHLAACTALCPDIEPKGEDASVSSKPNALILFNPVLRFSGIDQMMQRIDNDEELGKAISPVLGLEQDSPPTIIFFGTADRLVVHGEEFIAKAKELGANARMDLTEDQGHGYFNRPPNLQRTMRVADEFLRELGYVEGEPTVQVPE